MLAPHEQPDIWILGHSKASFEFIRTHTGYPHLHWSAPALLSGLDGPRSRRTKLFSWLVPKFFKREMHFDMIFPFPIGTKWQQTACWIPDFQEKHLPDFFSAEELETREQQHRHYFENYQHLVFSSAAAKQDFETFYPEARVNIHVVHFAVFDPPMVQSDASSVLAQYKLPQRFFYCPNQFWVHKNHELVIRSVALLKERGIEVCVVFSGKEHDHRAPDHTQKLKRLVASLNLEDQIRFLGFLPRDHQMVIFHNAHCIVQPSLFEGWSTVIEDAKSISQYVLASSIPANLEQATENIEFFDPYQPEALAALMEKYAMQDPPRKTIDYDIKRREFAQAVLSVVKAVRNTK